MKKHLLVNQKHHKTIKEISQVLGISIEKTVEFCLNVGIRHLETHGYSVKLERKNQENLPPKTPMHPRVVNSKEYEF